LRRLYEPPPNEANPRSREQAIEIEDHATVKKRFAGSAALQSTFHSPRARQYVIVLRNAKFQLDEMRMHRNGFYDHIQNQIVFALFAHLSDLVENRVTFIEVGAFDGTTMSNIHPHATNRGWHGLVIEPLPGPFAALQKSYKGFPAITPLQIAIGETDGTLPFYSVASEENGWEGMLSSTDRDTILSQQNLVADIETRVTELTVESKTLATVCHEHRIAHLDLLMVDAEGTDDIVVQSIDFAAIPPTLILLEHKHITNDRLFALDSVLLDNGYERIGLWLDTIYVRKPLSDDACVRRLISDCYKFFPPGRDPEWGNGIWFVLEQNA
jgi:FkbM family methyltransferase